MVAYRSVLEPIGLLLLPLAGDKFNCNDICFLRVAVFLSLVFATPRIRLSRRLVVLLGGLSVFIAIDLSGLYLWPDVQAFSSAEGESYPQLLFGFIWNLLGDLLLPVLLWLVAFDRHLGLFFPEIPLADEMVKKEAFFRQ